MSTLPKRIVDEVAAALELQGVVTLFPDEFLGEGSESWVFGGAFGAQREPVAVKIHKRNPGNLDAMRAFLDVPGCVPMRLWLNKVSSLEQLVSVWKRGEGSLRDELKKRGAGLPREQCHLWFRPVARALQTLHERTATGTRLVHRDVKPGRLFLFKRRSGGLELWLGGSCIAKEQIGLSDSDNPDGIGTPSYRRFGDLSRVVTTDVDLFALAVSYAESRLGKHPYDHGAGCVGNLVSNRHLLDGLDPDEVEWLKRVLDDPDAHENLGVGEWFESLRLPSA